MHDVACFCTSLRRTCAGSDARIVANSALASGFVLRDRGAYGVHQPERGGVQHQPHLIGSPAVTRHAIQGELRLVQLDQILYLSALEIKS
jgi:hypothetical protein